MTNSDVLLVQATWVLAIGTIISGGLVAYVTIHIGTKQNKMTSMLQVFELLQDEKHRKARGEVFRIKSLCASKESFPADFKDNAEMVRSDFSQMGALVRNGLVPKDLFMESYAGLTLRVWKALKDNLIEEREKRQQPTLQESFEWLAIEAEKYWNTSHPGEPVDLY